MPQQPTPKENLQAILDSPTYRVAEEDVEFLKLPELRAQRLQLEYLKSELVLHEQNIHTTIVLFGGTRVLEAAQAEAKLVAARAALEKNPGDAQLEHQVRIAERVLAKAPYYDAAREFAKLVSEKGQKDGRRECVIVTGGGPGIMEAGNRGAYDVGAASIGLNITIPHEQVPNPYITPELCFQFHYFALRKMHFLMRARAMVAFPGGFGTMDELFETLTLIQTHKMKRIPVILLGRDFWKHAINLQFFVDEGTISPEDMNLVSYADTAEETWEHIVNFYGSEPTDLELPPSPTDRI